MGLKEYTSSIVTIAAVAAALAIIAAYIANPLPELKDIAIFAVGALVGALTSANKRNVIETPPGAKVKCTCDIEG